MTRESSSIHSRSCRRRPRRNCNQAMKRIAIVITTTLGIATTNLQVQALSVPFQRLARPTTSFAQSWSPEKHHHHHSFVTNTRCLYSPGDVRLFMAPPTPQPRRPRRMLKKRTSKEGDGRRRKRNRRNRHAEGPSSSSIGSILPGMGKDATPRSSSSSSSASMTQEYRPLVSSVRRDRGEDYWIDPEDLEREQRRKEEQERQRVAFENRSDKSMSQEKLMTEVKAPYRQNWIGYFSLVVAILSIIVSQFPELLEPAPTTQFPDL